MARPSGCPGCSRRLVRRQRCLWRRLWNNCAHTIIPSHFHAVNQFQVVVEGQGTLGKRAVHPWTVHYTNGFTGYGPLCAAAAGMAFFTLRNR